MSGVGSNIDYIDYELGQTQQQNLYNWITLDNYVLDYVDNLMEYDKMFSMYSK